MLLLEALIYLPMATLALGGGLPALLIGLAMASAIAGGKKGH